MPATRRTKKVNKNQLDLFKDTDFKDPLSNLRLERFYDEDILEHEILVFDLETKKSADDVGGWGNIKDMGLAVAVLYALKTDSYETYWESDASSLIERLLEADLVIGFNTIGFDYKVLVPYAKDESIGSKISTFDILQDLRSKLNHRVSLDSVASATLSKSKTADGLQSLKWWKNKEYEKVASYCKVDVEVTKEVFEYGLKKKCLYFSNKFGSKTKVDLDWDIRKLLKKDKG